MRRLISAWRKGTGTGSYSPGACPLSPGRPLSPAPLRPCPLRPTKGTGTGRVRPGASPLCWASLPVLIAILVAGCRDDMYDQPKYKPLAKGNHLIGPTSALPLQPGTVARSERPGIDVIDTGMKDGKLAEDLPFPLTKAVLLRGQQRYRIYCTPCHGELGDGRGMIVERGMSPPPSFLAEDLRDAPIGHFYDVITRGHGAMYSYDARIPVEDRWSIAAYVRVLQWSRNVAVGELSESDRAKLPPREAAP